MFINDLLFDSTRESSYYSSKESFFRSDDCVFEKTESGYKFKVLLPGVNKSMVKISTFDDGGNSGFSIKVSGDACLISMKNKEYLICTSGNSDKMASVKWILHIDEKLDYSKSECTLEDGLLTIEVPFDKTSKNETELTIK